MPPAKASKGVVIRFGHPALERIDPSTSFLYAPHTVSALLVGGSLGEGVGCPRQSARYHPPYTWHLHVSTKGPVHVSQTNLCRFTGLGLLAYYAGVFGTQPGALSSNAGLWAAVGVFLGELALKQLQ
jgi:hypothetical protein